AVDVGLRFADAVGLSALPREGLAVGVAEIAAVLLVALVVGAEDRLRLRHLGLRRRHQAVVVLGMLQVVLAGHAVAGRLGVTGKLDVFLGDMQRRAADLHVRAVAFVGAGERVRALAVTSTHTLVLLS